MSDIQDYLQSDHYDLLGEDYNEFTQTMYQFLSRVYKEDFRYIKITTDSISYAKTLNDWVEYRSFVYPAMPKRHKEYRLSDKFNEALQTIITKDEIVSKYLSLLSSGNGEVVYSINTSE
ncbi:MAG: hypothetical protein K8L99_18330 [Anaerolineae bacterium]|nr:hypothetical protein [Anaerolineae bacterium]